MGGFLYFLPGRRTLLTRANVEDETALSAVLAGASIESALTTGPAGPGVLAAVHGTRLRFAPDDQVWMTAHRGDLHIGYPKAEPPGPDDLARAVVFDGHPCVLGDGNAWMVPVARSFVRGATLPQALVLGENGEVVSEALPEYAAVCADAERIWAGMADVAESAEEGGGSFTVADGWEIAVRALALSYRVDRDEISLLRLLTTRNQAEILLALIDWPAVEALQKKTPEAPGGAASADGDAGKSTDTILPSAS